MLKASTMSMRLLAALTFASVSVAAQVHVIEVLADKDSRFKSAEELRKLFQEHDVSVKEPAVTYCQSGGRASVMAFALELMGAKDVRNYYRSWSEWGNADDTPVVKPKQSGH